MSADTPNATSGRVRAGAGVERARAYRVPRHPAPIDLRLDGNEGAWMPERLRLAPSRDRLRSYPSAAGLEAAIARRLAIEPDRVIVTAGADDALARAIRAVAAPGRNVVLPRPTFEMIGRYATLSGLEARDPEWPSGTYPTDAVLEAVDDATAAIVVVSPNNPTGGWIEPGDLERVCAGAERALVVVDQAYGEYGDDDLRPIALAHPNALVTGTFSKAWGLAGLRVGYAAGPLEVVDWMRAVGQPYAVSGPSIAQALVALQHGDPWVAEHVETVRAQRRELTEALARLGASPLPSRANFVMAHFRDAGWVFDALAGLGIAVRRFEDARLEGMLRITLPGTDEGFDRLVAGFESALEPEAVLVGGGVRLEASGVDGVDVLTVEGPSGEDAALRAARVRNGLAKGRVRRAVIVTDSAVDITAAREVGVVPIGVSGADGVDSSETLAAAGAARVVSRAEDWKEGLR